MDVSQQLSTYVFNNCYKELQEQRRELYEEGLPAITGMSSGPEVAGHIEIAG